MSDRAKSGAGTDQDVGASDRRMITPLRHAPRDRIARQRHRRGRWAGVLLLLAFGAVAPAPVLAGEAEVPAEAEAYGLEVTVGYGGRSVDSDWQPVEVTLAPRRPVAATLSVRSTGGPSGVVSTSREVEVAAGARSAFRFLTPVGRIHVEIEEEGSPPLLYRAPDPANEDGFLVATLGAIPASPPPVRIDPTGQSGTWVSLDPGWLTVSADALDPVGTLVAAQSALEALPEDAARNLAAGVVDGTDLVVVAEREGPVDIAALGLPDRPSVEVVTTGTQGGAPLRQLAPRGPAWTLTEADAVPGGDPGAVVAAVAESGRGRVGVVGAAPGDGTVGRSSALWSQLAGPGARATHQTDSNPEGSLLPRMFGSAGDDQGLPTVPGLGVFLLLYVLVVGPVNGVVLARFGRPELAWATVPLVTVTFTVGALLGAVGSRPPLGVTARLAWWVEGAGSEAAVVGLQSPTPSKREATLPGRGWTVRVTTGGSAPSAVFTGSDTTLSFELGALEFGGAVGTRTTEEKPPLELGAVPTAGGLQVTVTNTSGGAFEEVGVRAGTASRSIGSLAPGATETVVIPGRNLRAVSPYRDVFEGLAGPTGAAPAPRSLEAILRREPLDGNPGLVWAVAGSRRGTSGAAAGQAPAEDRGTLYAVAVRPEFPADLAVSPYAVARSLVAQPADSYRPSSLAVEGSGGGESILRFRLPAGGRLDTLFSDLDRSDLSELEVGPPPELSVWDHPSRNWNPLDVGFPGGAGDPSRLVSPLGEVYVRATGGRMFDFSARSVSGIDVSTEEGAQG